MRRVDANVRTVTTRLREMDLSKIVALPCKEETIRGYSSVGLLIIDEAARVPDELYHGVRPMLEASDGRIICLSTPFGRVGLFYDAWTSPSLQNCSPKRPPALTPNLASSPAVGGMSVSNATFTATGHALLCLKKDAWFCKLPRNSKHECRNSKQI
jgi:hypothetical protein